MSKQREEKDLARDLQERRNDEGEWEDLSEKSARVSRPSSVVYSVRFSPPELAELRRVAAERGRLLSELIRTSVMDHIREADETRVDVGVGLVKFITRAEPSRVGTRGPRVEHTALRATSPTSTRVAA